MSSLLFRATAEKESRRSPIRRSFAWQAPVEEVPYFTASENSPLEMVDSGNELILGLKGCFVDEIEEVAGIWDGNENQSMQDDQKEEQKPESEENKGSEDEFSPGDKKDGKDLYVSCGHEGYLTYLAQIRLLCKMSAIKNKDIYPSSTRRAEALWRIPIGDIEATSSFDGVRATSACVDAYEISVRNLENLEQAKALTKQKYEVTMEEHRRTEAMGIAGRYRLQMGGMKYKRPFLTRDGYVGMGPLYMRPRDVVVVFMGARLPYVVRPVEGISFRLLGECYCDGIMDGEMVKKRKKKDFFLV
ncbi:hypothetical protein BU26DRAFT_575683 [Trematosphaeria pertusa]|uniref:Heterokaryon incompatibility domain-containing protein n=1 Tax=Trematosphaeria pertusa TaxID=390896 RepID=A0A6A6J375_9PLEO|nr:uncharacterized protein BU26DRAFT_575683 [Trematosphaeria pertusa]KAF2257159.1 hypothetical protein BU26DRAFT_575683 [Trematosphaeria pertusa]